MALEQDVKRDFKGKPGIYRFTLGIDYWVINGVIFESRTYQPNCEQIIVGKFENEFSDNGLYIKSGKRKLNVPYLALDSWKKLRTVN